jgi:hypothetical protein
LTSGLGSGFGSTRGTGFTSLRSTGGGGATAGGAEYNSTSENSFGRVCQLMP